MSDNTINVSQSVNDYVVLVCGKSATGKSMSLRNLRNPEGVLYLNCETGKKLPFKCQFPNKYNLTITEPYLVYRVLENAEKDPNIHTVVIDSLTYLLEMYEAQYVVNSTDGRKAWSNFAQFFRDLMFTYVAKSTKKIIFTAHTSDFTNEEMMVKETAVPVKGSLKNNGIESYFSIVIATKKIPLKTLEQYKSDLLTINSEDVSLGYKHVFQTRTTGDTTHERLRGPLELFSQQESFIDNDIQLVLDRLGEYYA